MTGKEPIIDDEKIFKDLKKEGLSPEKAKELTRKILKDHFRR